MNLFCLINLIFKLLLFNKCCNALYYENVIVSVFLIEIREKGKKKFKYRKKCDST